MCVYFWILKVAVISMHRVCPLWISPPALLELLALASPQCISVSLNRANSALLMTAPLILIDWQLQVAHLPPSLHNVVYWDIWIPRKRFGMKEDSTYSLAELWGVSEQAGMLLTHLTHIWFGPILFFLINFPPLSSSHRSDGTGKESQDCIQVVNDSVWWMIPPLLTSASSFTSLTLSRPAWLFKPVNLSHLLFNLICL